MMEKRKVKLKVVHRAWWFPEYEVPAHMSDADAEQYIYEICPDEVFDEYNNKYTYEQETALEVV
jgi:hypothetical protein